MIDLAHGRRRFHPPLDSNNATAYRPFFLDLKVPYMHRFQWTGEREPNEIDDNEGDEVAIPSGDAGFAESGVEFYWKVVRSGRIARSVRVGEGDGGDVTLKIQNQFSKTGGMAPFEERRFKRSEVVASTREE